jgi:hypothetical protein
MMTDSITLFFYYYYSYFLFESKLYRMEFAILVRVKAILFLMPLLEGKIKNHAIRVLTVKAFLKRPTAHSLQTNNNNNNNRQTIGMCFPWSFHFSWKT